MTETKPTLEYGRPDRPHRERVPLWVIITLATTILLGIAFFVAVRWAAQFVA